MSDTTLIRGGTVVTAERQWRADVLIAGETVAPGVRRVERLLRRRWHA